MIPPATRREVRFRGPDRLDRRERDLNTGHTSPLRCLREGRAPRRVTDEQPQFELGSVAADVLTAEGCCCSAGGAGTSVPGCTGDPDLDAAAGRIPEGVCAVVARQAKC